MIIDACQMAGHLQECFPALPDGITPRGVRVIEQIDRKSRTQDRIMVSEISEMLDVTRPGITAVLRELEKLGYVTKTRSEEDSRIVFVSLTERGKALCDRAVTQYHAHLSQVLCEIGDEEAQKLYENVQKILALVKEDTAHYLQNKASEEALNIERRFS